MSASEAEEESGTSASVAEEKVPQKVYPCSICSMPLMPQRLSPAQESSSLSSPRHSTSRPAVPKLDIQALRDCVDNIESFHAALLHENGLLAAEVSRLRPLASQVVPIVEPCPEQQRSVEVHDGFAAGGGAQLTTEVETPPALKPADMENVEGESASHSDPGNSNKFAKPSVNSTGSSARVRRPSVNSIGSELFGGFTRVGAGKKSFYQQSSNLDRILAQSRDSLGDASDLSEIHDGRTRLAASDIFDSAMGFFIVLNVIVIGVSCDLEPQWRGWTFIDMAFAAIFLFEVLIKNFTMTPRVYFFGPDKYWHVFEIMLVVFAILEVVITLSMEAQENTVQGFTIFRTLRLLRATRIARLCRLALFQELTILIKGTLGGVRILAWSSILLAIPLYSVALLFYETLGDSQDTGHGAESFSSVRLSFFTLFRCVIGSDCNDNEGRPIFALVAAYYGWVYGLLYGVLIFFMTLGLFNVIAAIFVENVVLGAKTSAQLVRRQKLRDRAFQAAKFGELVELFLSADARTHSNNGNWVTATPSTANRNEFAKGLSVEEMIERGKDFLITPELFELCRADTAFGEILSDLDVADDEQIDLFETLDVDRSGAIDMEELVDGISKLRGDARRSDVVGVNLKLQVIHKDMLAQFEEVSKAMKHFVKGVYVQQVLSGRHPSTKRRTQSVITDITPASGAI